MPNEQLSIVTCSYGSDAQRCRRLCVSIDRFVPATIEHCIIVPRRDYPLFRELHKGRRRVCITEDVVPGGFYQLPLMQKMWLGPQGLPVRGGIMQQMTKLSANYAVDSQFILFADSDLELIRPLDEELIIRGDRLRLQRVENASCGAPHIHWHHRAAKLLGQEPRYFGSDYVGELVTWRRDNLEGLQDHIETIHGQPWYRAIAQSLRFSEYVLYRAYVEHILGPLEDGHFYCADDICHCCWLAEDAQRLLDGSAVISGRAQAVLLQSNLGFKLGEEAAMLNAARRCAQSLSPVGNVDVWKSAVYYP